jgi:hypothetical protein
VIGALLRSFIVFLCFVWLISGCRLAPDDHAINNSWSFKYYRNQDGSLDSIPDSLKTPLVIFSESIDVEGNGPVRKFKADCDVYTDGEIIIQNLWLANTTDDSASMLVDSIFFDRLTATDLFTLDGDRLVLSADLTGIDMIFEK